MRPRFSATRGCKLALAAREGDVVWSIAEDKGVTLRTAAYIHALGRLGGAIEAHGTQQFFAS